MVQWTDYKHLNKKIYIYFLIFESTTQFKVWSSSVLCKVQKAGTHWNGLTVTRTVRRFFPEYQLQLVVELGRADFFRTQARQFGLGTLWSSTFLLWVDPKNQPSSNLKRPVIIDVTTIWPISHCRTGHLADPCFKPLHNYPLAWRHLSISTSNAAAFWL